MKIISQLIKTLAVVAGFVCTQPACAQSVDYKDLESVFGEPITTSAAGVPQRVSEVPANMTIITADEIRQAGTRSLPQILARVPGLDILQTGLSGYDVGVRGYQQATQPRLLVLLDGRQVFIDDYSRTLWANIPVNIDDIRQIEVVKGASSALFGSNAAGGVINIITYNPMHDDNTVASFSAGTQNTFTGDGTVSKNGSWGGTKFSVGGLHATEFSTMRNPSNDLIPALDPQHSYLTNQSLFQLAPHIQAHLEETYSQSTSNEANGISLLTDASKALTYSTRAGFDWQSSLGLISSDTTYNHSNIGVSEFTTTEPYRLTTDLYVSQVQDQFKIGPDHTFRAGLEYRHKDFVNSGSELIAQSPALAEDNYAVSGSWLWHINDKWSFTNAARFDRQAMAETGRLTPGLFVSADQYSHVNYAWSGNSDLVYQPTSQDSFRLGFGRGVQMPSLIQSGFNQIFNFSSVPLDAEGNPGLKPTIVEDYSFDYSRKVDPLASTFTLSTYFEENKDIVAALDLVGSQTIAGNSYILAQSQNVGNSHGWGEEIELKGKKNGFRWDASYSFASVMDSPGVKTNLGYQGSTPEHHLRLWAGYSTGPWEFDGNGQYVTSTQLMRDVSAGLTQSPLNTGGYLSLGGRIGYTVDDHFTLGISGLNVSRGRTQISPYPDIQRQLLLTMTGRL